MNEPYIIVMGQTIHELTARVNEAIRSAYTPIGSPFSTGNFTPPNPMLAQAMFKAPPEQAQNYYPRACLTGQEALALSGKKKK